LGIGVEAIHRRAKELDIPFMGNDGKTGETLVKSILAPMFAMRNLSVLSWVGQNILGNRDGAILRDPKSRMAKLQSKDKTVAQIVGGSPTTHVAIDYVESLDDWKVAWDFIHFQGFLDTKMSMQFTWQGSDSILAAPLIIDLTRFAALELRRGRGGPMRHLACFFKDPIAVTEQSFFAQWQLLLNHLQS
jgi:myo-inositol-1-phosphate synthase